MNQQVTAKQKSRADQETENEANRLIEIVHSAIATAATHDPDEDATLQACADRIERAARDLAVALRELAEQRKADAKLELRT